MRVTVLGTSSPYPRPGNPCSSFLFDSGRTRILIDAGSGSLAALLANSRLEDLDAIWVSHTHADHFADLAVIFYALQYADIDRPPLPVFGPAGWEERLRAFVSHSSSSPIEEAFVVKHLHDEEELMIGDIAFTAYEMNHDAQCFGFRATYDEKIVSFTGDTGLGSGLERLASGADLLICESGNGLEQGATGHLTAAQAGAVATAANVGELLLTHLAGADVEECVDAARAQGAQRVTGARPGMVITV
jgi:ribonuclease BN (tRNA processing enzyme)